MTPRVILVVADPGDFGGRAAARAAARPAHGPAEQASQVVLVTGDDVATAGWRHQVRTDGRASTALTLRGLGRTLADEDIAAVCFRAQQWSVPPSLRAAGEADTAYAHGELTALIVSWLHSLGCRAVNQVEGSTPCGPGWSQARWLQLAAEAGLSVQAGLSVDSPYSEAPAVRSVLVAGRRVLGAASPAEDRACRALGELSGCRLLEVLCSGTGAVCGVITVPGLARPDHARAAGDLLRELAA